MSTAFWDVGPKCRYCDRNSKTMRAMTARSAAVAVKDSRVSHPKLTAASSRVTLIEWCMTCDPNGCYSDADREAEYGETLTICGAWEAVRLLVDEE